MLVVFPLPLMPMKTIMKGFFLSELLIMSTFGTSNSDEMLFFSESATVSSIFPLCSRILTISFLRSSLILLITSTATLFSSSTTSSSQKSSSNWLSEMVLVVIISLNLWKKPFFSGSSSSLSSSGSSSFSSPSFSSASLSFSVSSSDSSSLSSVSGTSSSIFSFSLFSSSIFSSVSLSSSASPSLSGASFPISFSFSLPKNPFFSGLFSSSEVSAFSSTSLENLLRAFFSLSFRNLNIISQPLNLVFKHLRLLHKAVKLLRQDFPVSAKLFDLFSYYPYCLLHAFLDYCPSACSEQQRGSFSYCRRDHYSGHY